MTNVDLLVFGPHPDDIEIGFGGTVALHVARGFRVGLCDLTRGELGSNGTIEDRLAEAEAARAVLGGDWRVNLGWPDGGIYDTPDHVIDVVRLVRQCRPRVVAIPYWNDRHPDHRAASETLSRAVFKAGLRRFLSPIPAAAASGDRQHYGILEEADANGEFDGLFDADSDSEGTHTTYGLPAWRPQQVCYYFINDDTKVSFAVDVSSVYDKKRQALDCHRTQFTAATPDAVATRLTAPTFRQLIESRDAHLGALTGVAFAEGVVVREPILRSSLFDEEPR